MSFFTEKSVQGLYLPAAILYPWCSGNAKSCLETMIGHLVGGQGQPRGTRVHAMHLVDGKGWS